VTSTLTLDKDTMHTVMHHSSTSTYMPNFIKIKETYCGWTYVHAHICTYAHMDGRAFDTCFIRSTLSKSRPNYSQSS